MKPIGLGSKLSLLVVLGVLVSVGVMGFYFDSFLKDDYLQSTEKRMLHGFKRLSADLRDTRFELESGIAFIRTEEAFLASIDLVNHYQDKQHYNAILLDEEKKLIAQELLDRVKLSLNDRIKLYDERQELIAFVARTSRGYQLNFVSYEAGKAVLYSRYEDEAFYTRRTELNDHFRMIFRHKAYYTDESAGEGTITYHRHGNDLLMTSHLSIETDETAHVGAHIEMSRIFDEAYFEALSETLDMRIASSAEQTYRGDAAPLEAVVRGDTLNIVQTDESYLGAASIETIDGPLYVVVTLDKAALLRTLVENREQLLMLMLVVALIVLVALRVLFRRGFDEPLMRLVEQIRKIERHDYSPSEPVHTNDELEMISKNVNQLAQTISEREEALHASQRDLQFLSHHDALTDLPNRRLFQLRLEHAIEHARRQGMRMAVMFLDLDEFKHVNDTLGHNIGDELLKSVSVRLSQTVRSSDTLARIGGDEFNILIEEVSHVRDVSVVVEKLLADFKVPFICAGHEIRTSASIGIAMYPDDGEDTVTLIKHADLAMYQAKDRGRNSYSFFSRELSDYIKERMTYINALKDALLRIGEEFYLEYQPKVSLQSGAISGCEALVRWHSPVLGRVWPDRFIRVAEETNMILPLGEWILKRAFADFVSLKRSGCSMGKISVNVSSVQLLNSDMVRTLRQAMLETGIAPEEIELEITESYIATDVEKALRTLRIFREMNLELAIDDFGTGYSSMNYLQKLPVTRLKIDKSFVDDLPGSEENSAIARAIIALAKTFNLSITAEGVETEAQLRFLREAGCDEVQGYYFAKPMPFETLASFCADFQAKA